jgi:hypothetical protein
MKAQGVVEASLYSFFNLGTRVGWVCKYASYRFKVFRQKYPKKKKNANPWNRSRTKIRNPEKQNRVRISAMKPTTIAEIFLAFFNHSISLRIGHDHIIAIPFQITTKINVPRAAVVYSVQRLVGYSRQR